MTQATLTQLDCDERSSSYHDLDWHQFKLIQAGFASVRGIRLFDDRYTLEILMPGRNQQ